jgi:hypothetical protein
VGLQLAVLSGSVAGPAAQVLFGFAIEGKATRSDLEALEKATGIKPLLTEIYLQWPSEPEHGVFPSESLRTIEANGSLPVVTWEPMFIDAAKAEHAIPRTQSSPENTMSIWSDLPEKLVSSQNRS